MCAKSLQSWPTLCDPVEPSRLLCPRDSPGKNTGVSLPCSSSRRSSPPRDGIHIPYVSCINIQVLYHYCHLGSPTHWPWQLNSRPLPSWFLLQDTMTMLSKLLALVRGLDLLSVVTNLLCLTRGGCWWFPFDFAGVNTSGSWKSKKFWSLNIMTQ